MLAKGGRLSVELSNRIIGHILRGLRFLKKLGIPHGNLKLNNVLFSHGLF